MENFIIKSYCNAALLLATAIIFKPASATTEEYLQLITTENSKTVKALTLNINLAQVVCIESPAQDSKIDNCISLEQLVKPRQHWLVDFQATSEYVEFPLVLDIQAAKQWLKGAKSTKQQRRRFLQTAATQLNQLSVQAFREKLKKIDHSKPLSLTPIAINNSLLVNQEPDQIENELLSKDSLMDFATPLTDDQAVIGIIDSGVSQYHGRIANAKVLQFNPVEKSHQIKDTAFGHATAILSLLAVDDNPSTEKRLVDNGQYLSCNGLPNAKYTFFGILQCMNWLFLARRVDVVVNAWTAPKIGCVDSWRYPIALLFYPNSIPVFAAGNYATEKLDEKNMSRSPANLDFSNEDFTSLTVGALNVKNGRLESSSYGESFCSPKHSSSENSSKSNKHYQANLFAPGENLMVAVPFTKSSFQKVEGSSYAVVFVAAAVANLSREFPRASSKQISQALLETAKSVESKTLEPATSAEYGYGILDYSKARERLLELYPASR